jgi:hypothetical protein
LTREKKGVTAMKKPEPNVKTTVGVPERLWKRARVRALDERTSLRALLLEGLELRLAQNVKKGDKP